MKNQIVGGFILITRLFHQNKCLPSAKVARYFYTNKNEQIGLVGINKSILLDSTDQSHFNKLRFNQLRTQDNLNTTKIQIQK